MRPDPFDPAMADTEVAFDKHHRSRSFRLATSQAIVGPPRAANGDGSSILRGRRFRIPSPAPQAGTGIGRVAFPSWKSESRALKF
jgi:hypothetical protein